MKLGTATRLYRSRNLFNFSCQRPEVRFPKLGSGIEFQERFASDRLRLGELGRLEQTETPSLCFDLALPNDFSPARGFDTIELSETLESHRFVLGTFAQ